MHFSCWFNRKSKKRGILIFFHISLFYYRLDRKSKILLYFGILKLFETRTSLFIKKDPCINTGLFTFYFLITLNTPSQTTPAALTAYLSECIYHPPVYYQAVYSG